MWHDIFDGFTNENKSRLRTSKSFTRYSHGQVSLPQVSHLPALGRYRYRPQCHPRSLGLPQKRSRLLPVRKEKHDYTIMDLN